MTKKKSPLKSNKPKSNQNNQNHQLPQKIKEKSSSTFNCPKSNQEEMSTTIGAPVEVEASTSTAATIKPKTALNSNCDLKVLVPSWRHVPIKRAFGMEGTEVNFNLINNLSFSLIFD